MPCSQVYSKVYSLPPTRVLELLRMPAPAAHSGHPRPHQHAMHGVVGLPVLAARRRRDTQPRRLACRVGGGRRSVYVCVRSGVECGGTAGRTRWLAATGIEGRCWGGEAWSPVEQRCASAIGIWAVLRSCWACSKER